MTEAQKAAAFNGDYRIYLKIAELVKRHGVADIVETGTYKAATTIALREICPHVITIEINDAYYNEASKNLATAGITDVVMLKGNSAETIKSRMFPHDKTLFFLDAHWNSYNPLIDELKAIARHKIKPCIVIHDFYVPGKSTTVQNSNAWGFDSYGGQDYNWEWIKPHIEAIYRVDGYEISYNDDYDAPRGCIFIEPKI